MDRTVNMEPISGVASIIAVLQLSALVTSMCYDYLKVVKGASKDITNIINETRNLETVLLQLQELQDLDTSSAGANSLSLLCWARAPGGPLDRCLVELGAVAHVLRPSITSTAASAMANGFRETGKALMWPFKQKAVLQSMEMIRREKETLNLALTGDTAAVVRSAEAGVKLLQVAENARHRQDVLEWLMATSPTSNHSAARKEHEPTTGEWFLKGETFQKWKTGSEPFMWLHGIPGCGKSILCSSIIEATLEYCADKPDHAMAYFYFDFNSSKGEQITHFISALVTQLCPETEIPRAVECLYENHISHSSRPILEELLRTLHELSEIHGRIYIIIDALDECTKREELLKVILNIFTRKEKFKVLVTSRRERDIELAMKDVVSRSISVQSSNVDADIQKFVRSRLSSDSKLKTWSEATKSEIETTLVERSHGMFRWVVCQLESLRSCVTRTQLKAALKSLPKTLNETYDRILVSIDENHREIALRVLQWLSYSVGRRYLTEIAEACAVRNGDFALDPDDKLRDPREIFTICSSLITEVNVTDQYGKQESELRLSHYSVKEYLDSDGIKNGPASYFSLEKISANRSIAETSLTYLLSFQNAQETKSMAFRLQFPLFDYAANYWYLHTQRGAGSSDLTYLSLLLLGSKEYEHCLHNWLRSHRPDIPYAFDRQRNASDSWVKTPLYYASCCGLLDTAKSLLTSGADVNGGGGRGESPLMGAINRGRAELVELLLENGADARIWTLDHYIRPSGFGEDVRDGGKATPLHVAAASGNQKIVSLLLDNGANINAIDSPPNPESIYGYPLTHAASSGNADIVKLLLERGADISVSTERDGGPLQQAAYRDRPEVVQLLLDHGADVNAHGGEYGNALCAAIAAGTYRGVTAMVRVLLDYGADVNAEVFGYPGRALLLASKRSLPDVMSMLLEAGADINARGAETGTALTATAWGFGNAKAMRLLLDHGANVNVAFGSNVTALDEAISIGNEEGVKLLLDYGADLAMLTHNRSTRTRLLVAVRCCAFSNPSLEAIARNAEHDLRILLRSRALEVALLKGNSQFEKILITAAIAKNGKAMEVLLEEVDGPMTAQYEKTLERALVEAAHNGSLAVVKLLLKKGVSPDSRYDGESALQAAWASNFEGHIAVSEELLKHGARGEWPFNWEKGTRWVELTRWVEKL